jgi:hypothetical protein
MWWHFIWELYSAGKLTENKEQVCQVKKEWGWHQHEEGTSEYVEYIGKNMREGRTWKILCMRLTHIRSFIHHMGLYRGSGCQDLDPWLWGFTRAPISVCASLVEEEKLDEVTYHHMANDNHWEPPIISIIGYLSTIHRSGWGNGWLCCMYRIERENNIAGSDIVESSYNNWGSGNHNVILDGLQLSNWIEDSTVEIMRESLLAHNCRMDITYNL